MKRLIPIESADDVPAAYRDTPIGDLVRYHNLGAEHRDYERAELLIGMCMDHRKRLRIPDNFAYILRSGGGNLRPSEFKVSYAIAVGGVRALALLGHTGCGMVNLASRRRQFVDGLVDGAGWDPERAEQHFLQFAPLFEIGDEVDFVIAEAKRLRLSYPKITVAPLLYQLDDGRLYGLAENLG